MSVAPATTAHPSDTLKTSTEINPTSSNQTKPPALNTRPTGWHAKSFGFDWNKRADHHKYLVKSGLPEVHAAIVNDDWDVALELICPEDFGLQWLPPASQRPPQNGGTDLDASTWTVDLPSNNEDTRNNAILEMALHTTYITSVDDNCLYGANLLTLCLLKPDRPDVLQHVISLAATLAPNYLNLPDAIGRTPLLIAVENQDQTSMQMLLKAGADPMQACRFSAEGEPKSPLSIAAKYPNKEIFRDLLRATIEQWEKFTPYDYNEDPLHLKRWASSQSSKDVLWLADQVQALRGPLLCYKDKSGSSYFYRSVIDGSLDEKLANGNEDLIEWLRMLDTSPVISDDIESSPLYAAASLSPVATFQALYDFFQTRTEEEFNTQKLNQLSDKFMVSKTIKDYDQYLKGRPEITENQKSIIVKDFINAQFDVLSSNPSTINWDDYARTIKNVWSFISDDEKNTLVLQAVFISNDHKDLVLSLLDCELKERTLDEILITSARKQNTTAFEFAAERSTWSHTILNALKEGKDVGREMFMWALYAGSLKWVEKLIVAGFNLQRPIDSHPEYLPKLADIDPDGIAKKLKGINYKITSYLIGQAKTEAGKRAMIALTTKANNHG